MNGYFLTIADLVLFFNRQKKKLALIFIMTSLLLSLMLIMRPPKYEAIASFQDTGHAGSEEQVRALKKMMDTSQSQYYKGKAAVWIPSSQVLERVIQDEGLQCQLMPQSLWKRFTLMLKAHFKLEAYQTGQMVVDRIVDATYKGDQAKEMTLHVQGSHLLRIVMDNEVQEVTIPGRFEIGPISCAIKEPFTQREVGSFLPVTWIGLDQALLKTKHDFHIRMNEMDRNVLKLSFLHPSKSKAKSALNAMMKIYQKVLKNDLDRVIMSQMDYLTYRQEQLFDQFEGAMKEHVGYFKNNIKSHGFMMTSDWLSQRNALDIKFEDRLQKVTGELENSLFIKEAELLLPDEKNRALLNVLAELRQKREALPSSLSTATLYSGTTMDLKTCESLLDANVRRMEALKKEISELNYVHEHILQNAFDLSGLSMLFGDPMAEERIREGALLMQQLNAPEQLGQKELEKAEKKLKQCRYSLKRYIEQRIEIGRNEEALLQEQIDAIQSKYLTRLDREIQTLQTQNQHRTDEYIKLLQGEKLFLEKKRSEFKQELEYIPNQWMSETLLKLKSDLNYSILEGLSQLIESTNVKHHMMQVEARPIDFARVGRTFYTFSPLLSGIIGGGLVALIVLAGMIFRSLRQGFPIAFETLKHLNAIVYPHFTDERSPSFRSLIHGLSGAKYIALFQSNALTYAQTVAQFYAEKLSKKVLFIQINEGAVSADLPSSFDQIHFDKGYLSFFSEEEIKKREALLHQYDQVIVAFDLRACDPEAALALQHFDRVVMSVQKETYFELAPLIGKNNAIFIYV
ncbi:MAG: hypothetical protein K9M07_04170 [Simkaniaceae bacterium]|nr:hypothetical protein [Simkaniaceae bacterium]